MEIGVNIHDWVIAHFSLIVACLNNELSQSWTVIGSIVLGEEAHISTEVTVQNFRYLESQIEIGVDVDARNWENIFFGRLLIGDKVFPIERTESDILTERGCDKTDHIVVLHRTDSVSGTPESGGNGVSSTEIRVVFDSVYGYTQCGARFTIAEKSLDAGMDNFIQIAVVPPIMACVVVSIVESGIQSVEECSCRQCYSLKLRSADPSIFNCPASSPVNQVSANKL